MRWTAQALEAESATALPGLARLSNLVRSVQTPEFAGITFHEVLAKSALNHVSAASRMMAGAYTVNPYRGCTHACVYCFARPTHEYLELDAGRDFDQQIVVKVNVGEVLRRELARPSWQRPPVALGTNTDPYQRAEGRYALMPSVLGALAESGTPFSVLTKGSLLRRDLDLVAAAAQTVPVSLALSIAVYDDELQQSIEPGTPSTAARLATVRAVREKGLDCQVFLMPVLPLLTDGVDQLDHALGRIADAGASSVVYSALHLKPGVKQWFFAWLGREHPELLPAYSKLYGARTYAPKEYTDWLAERIRPLIRKHRLHRGRPVGVTGHVLPEAVDQGLGPLTPGSGGSPPSFGPVADAQPLLF
ncbi:Rv2578c family radical SAM protein [Herbiconiux moechotypicola]|uniref:Rv2578c family radical SAM protein n=1 Tax=Herbiconiux moechotypicola TaxID=637393 RepID=A0ABN3E7U2_9MICO|nr:Rv2578c family radical SAM protein [Herbiconiux moechotypicola]MCS5731979.1 Rv2578c family radical SAM protein [Herbiconiux moechotypicola]